jgi:low temperature requirement protein LtrA
VSSLLVDSEHRVSTVELFFDLVFVFAFTQVTTLWLEQATWHRLGLAGRDAACSSAVESGLA